MILRYVSVIAAIACTGCASIVNETTHAIRIETKSAGGDVVPGADCKLSNDYGATNAKSGDSPQVRRSGKDLDIVCSHPANPDATARVISRANAGMFGNIIFGGGIGAIIDHTKGTAYSYPTWIQLIFGKSLVFDRSAEKDGQPTPPTEPPATAATK